MQAQGTKKSATFTLTAEQLAKLERLRIAQGARSLSAVLRTLVDSAPTPPAVPR